LFEHTGQLSNATPDFGDIHRREPEVKALVSDRTARISKRCRWR